MINVFDLFIWILKINEYEKKTKIGAIMYGAIVMAMIAPLSPFIKLSDFAIKPKLKYAITVSAMSSCLG